MRALGVSGTGNVLYLAVAADGSVVDEAPYTFEPITGLPASERLPALHDEATKMVRAMRVGRVRILDPESTYQTTVQAVQARLELETLLALGAAEAGVDCARMTRGKLRSLLELPKKGQLVQLVGQVTDKVGPHWGPRKRDLAALAALAAERLA